MNTRFRFIFIVIASVMVAMVAIRFFRMSMGKTSFVITVPTYSRSAPETYFTSTYVEKDGCIIFKDEFNFEHKVCGAYQIEKW